MIGHPEVADCAERHFPDAVCWAVLDLGELAIFGHLAAPEEGPVGMLERGLRGEAVVLVAMTNVPPPSERAGELPARRDVVDIQRACRPAFLIDSRLELLGVDQTSPTALKRESPRRIPRQANRGRVE